ncbi:unnamed protein product [Psylliodes chrysocephalus]|uniref:THAP-type domain-containing protein n=1 Tax=Psylliodes chrysocephalus TaxID=3402493 RepID=A0A9P0GMW7_9CUCU|nr:unnamed protein product [Psylliodes chrysocephala]
MARVAEVHQGDDKKVRVVTLTKAGGNKLKRSIHTLIPLPTDAESHKPIKMSPDATVNSHLAKVYVHRTQPEKRPQSFTTYSCLKLLFLIALIFPVPQIQATYSIQYPKPEQKKQLQKFNASLTTNVERFKRGILGKLLTSVFGVNDEVYQDIEALQQHQEELIIKTTSHQNIQFNRGTLYDLMSPAHVREIIASANQKLPANLRIRSSPTINIALENIDKEIQIFSSFVILDISNYELIRVTPTPFYLANGSYYLLDISRNLIAIDYNNNLYFELSEEEINHCIPVPNHQYICSPSAVRNIETSPNCVIDEIYERPGRNYCHVRQFSTSSIVWQQLHMPNTWLFLTDKPTKIAVTCSGIREDVLLNITGFIKLLEDCVIKTNQNILQPKRGSHITNMELAQLWIDNKKDRCNDIILNKLRTELNLKDCCESDHKSLIEITRLERKVHVPNLVDATQLQPGSSKQARGRPYKPFEEVTTRVKKSRVSDLVANRTAEELRFAADLASGKSSGSEQENKKCLTPHQALALCLDLDLSDRNLKIARKSFLPTSLKVTDTSAEVELQNLLDLTAQSICKILDIYGTRFKLIYKWGMDGSSGHSIYEQLFSNDEDTDEFMFLVALVPLRLIDVDSINKCWINKKPSSTLFCRPVKFVFAKENRDLVRNEEAQMQQKIDGLQQSKIIIKNGKEISVKHDLIFTMMDGSVANTLSNINATSKCIICGATPSQMNVGNVVNRPPNISNYRFGLSSLHCWIRFFECFLHISYKLPIKCWQARGDENKRIVEKNKKRIQAEFKSKMGLIVDKPKPGYGSSNDGNTARRFFFNPQLSSEITGINKELIQKCSIILRVIASGCEIDLELFAVLLKSTREMYLHLYKWYNMPSGVHKILVHGCDIIGSFDLPIGQLSEEALEARHKEVRKHRLSHTRKTSRDSKIIAGRRICSEHFSKDNISGRRLKKDAEPDIFNDEEGFKEDCEEKGISKKDIPKSWLYSDIFNSEFNLSFSQPSNDTCDLCDEFIVKLKDTSSMQQRQSIQEEYDRHLLEAEKRYSEKKKDKEESQGKINVKVIMVDLQKCLPTPLLHNAELLFSETLVV